MKPTKLSAGILFTDGKKILLLKRSTEGDHLGKWTIPGGKIEKGESLKDAARRESYEECGYNSGAIFGQYDHKDNKKLFRTYFYAINKLFEPIISSEHSEARWVNLDDVDDLELHPKFHDVWDHFKNKIKDKFSGRKSFQEWVKERNSKFF